MSSRSPRVGRAALVAAVVSVLACAGVVSGPARAIVEPFDPFTPPIPSSVAETITRTQAKPLYDHSTWGLQVSDATTGEVLVSQNSARLFPPGSIMKVYTAAAVLDAYGRAYRFHTPVFRTGDVKGGTLNGNLVLVASGDYSFGLRERPNGKLAFNSAPEADHNNAYVGLPGPTTLKNSNPLAGVDQLAEQVRGAGVRRVRGNVVIDDRLFETFTHFTGGPITPIWINENVLDITSRPTTAGKPARVTYRPATAAWRVQSAVKTGKRGSQPSLTVSKVSDGLVRIGGSVPAGGGPILKIFEIPDPAAFARTAFIEALERHGVRVDARATGANPTRVLPRSRFYPASRRVAQRVSPPLSEYTKVILKVSYNRGANLMVCLTAVRLGSRNCEDGLRGIVRNNARLGVPPSTTFPFDGAGSDNRDRTTPEAMTTFLRNVRARSYGSALRYGLPIVGVDGTLATVEKGTPVAGKIQAKTGNLLGCVFTHCIEGAHTHVGYIEAESGRLLVFADLVANIPLGALTDIFGIDDDLGGIEAAIQQGY